MQSPTMRDKAVALAQQGFRVFPLTPNSKKPPIVPANKTKPPTGKYHDAIPSSDPADVHEMWTDTNGGPLPYNIGISCDGMFVIDVDNKGTKLGDGALSEFAEKEGLELKTLETRTPTGGRHLFYKLPEGVVASNNVDTLAPGLDVRGKHGYVVAPGSVVPEGEYRWARGPDAARMADAPYSIVDICRKSDATQEQKQQPVTGVELDLEDDVEDASLWLEYDAPEAIALQGGNQRTYEIACTVRDFAISEPMCLALMENYWNRIGKAVPPWSRGELEQIVGNAYAYARNPIGINIAQAQFEPVPLGELGNRDSMSQEPVTKKTRLFWEGFDASRHKMVGDGTAWLVKRYLGRNEMSVLYGDSNTGKTFVALDLAYHIATGQPWNGHKVKGGLVVYVAAEAGPGIRARLEALHRRYQPGTEPPLVVIPCSLDLSSPNADLRPLLALLAEIGAAYGLPIAMVVLDTLARVIGPGDENSARDMGLLVNSVDRIRVETGGAHSMIVHHSGKNTANGARGSSALRAATDTELEVKDGKIIMRKQRNGEIMRSVGFRLATVALAKDEDGESVTSCTVELGVSVDFVPLLTPLQEERVKLLRAYVEKHKLAVFTHKEIGEAWAGKCGGETDRRIIPETLSERAVRDAAVDLENAAVLEKVSKKGAKTNVYRFAADAAENAAVDS